MDETKQRVGDGPMAGLIEKILGRMEKNYSSIKPVDCISTGYLHLDQLYGGFSPGTLWTITSRPALGKTALVANMALHVALRENKRVAIFTGDHSADDFVQRLISIESGVPLQNISSAYISESEWPRLINVAAKLTETNISFFDSTWISVKEIRKITESRKFDIIIVDKFHSLILKDEAAEGSNNRINELNQAAIELKGLAREVGATVIILCDINKGQEQRADRRPMLIDLKDFGGVLESYSDVVLGLYTPSFEVPDEERGISELIPLKNRFGERWLVRLIFRDKFGIFENIPPSGNPN